MALAVDFVSIEVSKVNTLEELEQKVLTMFQNIESIEDKYITRPASKYNALVVCSFSYHLIDRRNFYVVTLEQNSLSISAPYINPVIPNEIKKNVDQKLPEAKFQQNGNVFTWNYNDIHYLL